MNIFNTGANSNSYARLKGYLFTFRAGKIEFYFKVELYEA